MLKKHFNPKRELKKVQKKGIYNPKTKLIGVFGLLGFIALTCSSYALFTFMSNKSLAFNSKSTKIVKITLNVTNGKYASFANKILQDNEIQAIEEINFNKGTPTCANGSYWSSDCDSVVPNGTGLVMTPDNDGTSYLFRGEIENNYVMFAGQKWRIIRINGDGSVRLIYVDKNRPNSSVFNEKVDNQKYAGYTFDNTHACTQNDPCISDYQNGTFTSNYGDKTTKDSTLKGILESWYKENIADKELDDYVALSTFCNDTSISDFYNSNYSYGRDYNYKSPTLVCPDPTDYDSDKTHDYGGVYKLKIGLLTKDEMITAGATSFTDSYNNYWLYAGLLFSPSDYYSSNNEVVFYTDDWPGLATDDINFNYAIYPVINLKGDLEVTGDGTEENPYEVKKATSSSTVVNAEYNVETRLKIFPDKDYVFKSVKCNPDQEATYDDENNELVITPTKGNMTCDVTFAPSLKASIIANNTMPSKIPDFYKGSPECVSVDYSSYVCAEHVNDGGLYTASDDKGTSYYFRGATSELNNNVTFASRKWKILRINGDGSIRLILVDSTGPANSAFNNNSSSYKYTGYTYNTTQACTNSNPCVSDYQGGTFTKDYGGDDSTMKTHLEKWYQSTLAQFDEKITLATYCNDTTFNAFYRKSAPILTCPEPPSEDYPGSGYYGGVYRLKIGLPTVDELIMAGIAPEFFNTTSSDNYLYSLAQNSSWTMSPYSSDGVDIYQAYYQDFTWDKSNNESKVNPVINLKANVSFTTNGSGKPGSANNPYIIN